LKIHQHILSESQIPDLTEKMLIFITHFVAHSYMKFIAAPCTSISSTHCDPKFSWIWHTVHTVHIIQPFCLFHIQRKYCDFFTNRELISQTNKFTVNKEQFLNKLVYKSRGFFLSQYVLQFDSQMMQLLPVSN
jgi:hypothetical protein